MHKMCRLYKHPPCCFSREIQLENSSRMRFHQRCLSLLAYLPSLPPHFTSSFPSPPPRGYAPLLYFHPLRMLSPCCTLKPLSHRTNKTCISVFGNISNKNKNKAFQVYVAMSGQPQVGRERPLLFGQKKMLTSMMNLVMHIASSPGKKYVLPIVT